MQMFDEVKQKSYENGNEKAKNVPVATVLTDLQAALTEDCELLLGSLSAEPCKERLSSLSTASC